MSPVKESTCISLPGGGEVEVAWQRASGNDMDALLRQLDEKQRQRAHAMRQRRRFEEYVLTRSLLAALGSPAKGHRSISHCAHWVAVAAVRQGTVGLDVECRLPRHREAVAERLGWNTEEPSKQLQAWTLWEAWRKLEGGSVLDEPEATYAGVLRHADELYGEPQSLYGASWWSLDLDGACLSVCARDDRL